MFTHHPRQLAWHTALALTLLAQSGCFTALSRWGGEKPTPAVAVTAATADIATSPIQVPVLTVAAIRHAATKPTKAEIAAAQKRHEEEVAENNRVMDLAKAIFERLKANPGLFNDDVFWREHESETRATHLAFIWFIREPEAPASPEINRRLFARFPDNAAAIYTKPRTTHAELTALVTDPSVPYPIREASIYTLVCDPAFDFGEPWRTILLRDFPIQTSLLFDTLRYTKDELTTIRDDPTLGLYMRNMAKAQLADGSYKKTAAQSPATAASP